MLIPTLILLIYRYLRYPKIIESLQPLFAIFAAPFSLCLVGYLQSFSHLSGEFLLVLLFFSLVFYGIGFLGLRSIFRLAFFPSFASYTFPFVNSAIALKLTIPILRLSRIWQVFNDFQIIVAVLLVFYVFVRYLLFFANVELEKQIFRKA